MLISYDRQAVEGCLWVLVPEQVRECYQQFYSYRHGYYRRLVEVFVERTQQATTHKEKLQSISRIFIVPILI